MSSESFPENIPDDGYVPQIKSIVWPGIMKYLPDITSQLKTDAETAVHRGDTPNQESGSRNNHVTSVVAVLLTNVQEIFNLPPVFCRKPDGNELLMALC